MEILERYKSIIPDWEAFLDAARTPLPTNIWTNPLRTDACNLRRRLEKHGLRFEPVNWCRGAFRFSTDFDPGKYLEYLAGLYQVQEEVAMLPVSLLDPQPGERVLDLCAAPGNKTAQIAVMMQNRGTVFANEVNGNRIRPLRQAINRLGLTNVISTVSNAATFPRQDFGFDKILVDVQCSCEGTSRKNPEILRRPSDSYSEKISAAQTAILVRALRLCRPGGKIAYATCTYAPEENEAVVDAALQSVLPRIDAKVLPVEVPEFNSEAGLTSWRGRHFRADVANALRVYPHQNDTGGFFVAIIEKSGDAHPDRITRKPGSRKGAHGLQSSDTEQVLAFLQERFGIGPAVFDEFIAVESNKKYVSLLSRESEVPENPVPQTLGLPFVHARMQQPKLTTAGAMAFGRHACRNVLQMDGEQVRDFVSGGSVALTTKQIVDLRGSGTVVVMHDDFCLGVGILRQEGQTCWIESQFPKAWQSGLAP